jgi:hypothetical protein
LEEEKIEEPQSIVTDRELALINVFDDMFPRSYHILCRWHVMMNVLAKCKRFFPAPVRSRSTRSGFDRHPQFKEFLRDFNKTLAVQTDEVSCLFAVGRC